MQRIRVTVPFLWYGAVRKVACQLDLDVSEGRGVFSRTFTFAGRGKALQTLLRLMSEHNDKLEEG